jgi:hypothetical protein
MDPEPVSDPEMPVEESSVGNAIQLRRGVAKPLRLFQFAIALLAAALVYLGVTAKVADPAHLALGLAIVVLGFLPTLTWIKQAQFGLPIFETFMATTVSGYGLPLIRGHEELRGYSVGTITLTAFVVVVFQAVAIVTYVSVRALPKHTRFWRESAIPGDISKFLGYGMFLTTGYAIMDQFTDWIPSDLEGPIRATCFGLGIIATFVECRRWGLGEFTRNRKITFAVQLGVLVVFNLVGLFLVQAISILILALLGYVSGSKVFPVMVTVIVLPLFSILHQGKSTMRQKYWENKAPAPTLTQLPDFFGEWFEDGLTPVNTSDPTAQKASILDRTSLIQILCLVVANTPERLPYLDGETYAQIPAQFVPRFFWPEKPVGHISTYTLSVYYGLQQIEDTQKTTIGFGLLAEAYANFGLFGVSLIAFVFGGLFKKFCGWAAESPILSYPGMILILLVAWSFQDELTLSIWLSSLFQAVVVVCLAPFTLNRFFSS